MHMANKKTVISFHVTALYLLTLLANGKEPNLNLPNFVCPLYFFFSRQAFLHIFCILVSNVFTAKCTCKQSRCQYRWETLKRRQCQFQQTKFINLEVLSPCETQLYYYNEKIQGDWN